MYYTKRLIKAQDENKNGILEWWSGGVAEWWSKLNTQYEHTPINIFNDSDIMILSLLKKYKNMLSFRILFYSKLIKRQNHYVRITLSTINY